MPIGTVIIHGGVRYTQLLPNDQVCPGPNYQCTSCYRNDGVAETVSMSTPARKAKRKNKDVFIHPDPRPLDGTIEDTRAVCEHYCSMHATASEPLRYCYGIANAIILVCEGCIVDDFTRCWAEGCFALDTVSVHDRESLYSRVYADQTFFGSSDGYFPTHEEYLSWQQAREHREQANPTYGYHETNPIRRFEWPPETQRHELCFGVELEMERKGPPTERGSQQLSAALGGRDGNLQGLRDANLLSGRYILARDGSLNATGVELITSPYTLEFHQAKFGWPALLETVAGIGMSGKGTDRCGMHVHCNRQAISALTLGKMLVFANSLDNKLLIERVAQRDSSFARKSPKKVIDGKRLRGDQKYDALNITQETIEFRIFRGNLRPERVLKNIEFCHAVITYCQTASIPACQTSNDFIAWLGKNRGPYKNLVKFLAPHHGYKLTRKDVTKDI